MFKKGLSFFVVGCFLLSFLLIGVGHSQTKTVTLTYSIFFPATHTHTLLATEWAKEIEKRTNGAVKIYHVSRGHPDAAQSVLRRCG